MASDQQGILILGAGHAGGRAAEALRAAGFTGDVTLLGDEVHLPYERPPLSKDLLLGLCDVAASRIQPAEYYESQGIALRLGARATAIDRARRQVRLEDGAELSYGTLLLATGARPRRLAVPGSEDARLNYLRNIDDALALRERLTAGTRLVVIGGGFIGLEVAAAARQKECAVTVVELAPALINRCVAAELSGYFRKLHEERGVVFHMPAQVERIEGGADAATIVLTDGTRLPADIIVAGIGAIPNVELAREAGLVVDDGVVVDEYGRTEDPQIYAAGDVTRHFNPLLGRHIRLEAWQNAQNQAIAVAQNLAGAATPYAEVPWFWTDQYDVNFQMAGLPESWDELVWRGSPEDPSFVVFYLKDSVVVAANTVNAGREMRFIRQLITSRKRVDPAALRDRSVKLQELSR